MTAFSLLVVQCCFLRTVTLLHGLLNDLWVITNCKIWESERTIKIQGLYEQVV